MAKKKEYWPDRYVTSQKMVAEFFGNASNSITTWLRDPTAPKKTAKGYDILAIARWRYRTLERLQRERQGDTSVDVDGTTRTREETIKLMIANQRMLLQWRLEAKELVAVEDVKAEWIYIVNAIRQRLEALPGELASSIDPEHRPDFLADAKNKLRLACKSLESWGADDSSS